MKQGGWVVWLALMVTSAAPQEQLQDGLAALKDGRPEVAWRLFDQALQAAPKDLSARYWRGRASLELHHWPAAIDDFVSVVRRKPSSVPTWVDLGRAYLGLGRYRDAQSAFEQALGLQPGLAAAQALLARATAAAASATSTDRTDGSTNRRPWVAPELGPRLAIQTSGLPLEPRRCEVDSGRLLDYTFGSAPTDWEPAGGTWAISSRYACEPEWSFFGGHSRGICSLWNKRHFAGDIAVEAYLAFKHGLPWADEKWHYVPSDLNLNLCSTNGDLSTGYSFIYSGRNSTATMLRKGSKVLAQSRQVADLLPQFSDHNPLYQQDEHGKPFGEFHRRWWRLEARRHGGRLTMLVDGRVVLQADDPTPVESGQVAVWTVGNGLVIARLRIAFQRELSVDSPSVVVTTPVPLSAPRSAAARP